MDASFQLTPCLRSPILEKHRGSYVLHTLKRSPNAEEGTPMKFFMSGLHELEHAGVLGGNWEFSNKLDVCQEV